MAVAGEREKNKFNFDLGNRLNTTKYNGMVPRSISLCLVKVFRLVQNKLPFKCSISVGGILFQKNKISIVVTKCNVRSINYYNAFIDDDRGAWDQSECHY